MLLLITAKEDALFADYLYLVYTHSAILVFQAIWLVRYLWLTSISIYTLSGLGVLSDLIGSLSLANEHYSPPTEWIMRKPNKNKMAGVNLRFARLIKSIFNGFLLKMLLRSLPVYILKQLFFSISVKGGRIFYHYSPRFQRIIGQFRYIKILTWLRGLGE